MHKVERVHYGNGVYGKVLTTQDGDTPPTPTTAKQDRKCPICTRVIAGSALNHNCPLEYSKGGLDNL